MKSIHTFSTKILIGRVEKNSSESGAAKKLWTFDFERNSHHLVPKKSIIVYIKETCIHTHSEKATVSTREYKRQCVWIVSNVELSRIWQAMGFNQCQCPKLLVGRSTANIVDLTHCSNASICSIVSSISHMAESSSSSHLIL